MAIRTDFTAGEVLAAADLNDTFAAKLNLAGGKILQIVRATDTTLRTTTSGSMVDASISVTITPQYSTSSVLLIWSYKAAVTTSGNYILTQITNASNSAISGTQQGVFRSAVADQEVMQILIGFDSPATTSATTYKGRFSSISGTVTLGNSTITGQLYAIEVSA
jgi:hypothetical protein